MAGRVRLQGGEVAARIASYRTHRIEGPINGAETAGWSYIERIEIRDVEQYQRDMASPAGQELIRQLYDTYLDRPKNIFFWSEEIVNRDA